MPSITGLDWIADPKDAVQIVVTVPLVSNFNLTKLPDCVPKNKLLLESTAGDLVIFPGTEYCQVGFGWPVIFLKSNPYNVPLSLPKINFLSPVIIAEELIGASHKIFQATLPVL